MWLRLPHGPVTVRTGPCSAQDGAPTPETAPGPSWGQPGPAGTRLPAPTGVAQPRVTATVAWCHARGSGPALCAGTSDAPHPPAGPWSQHGVAAGGTPPPPTRGSQRLAGRVPGTICRPSLHIEGGTLPGDWPGGLLSGALRLLQPLAGQRLLGGGEGLRGPWPLGTACAGRRAGSWEPRW